MNKKLSIFRKIFRFVAECIHNEKRVYKVNLKSNEKLWIFNCCMVIGAIIIEYIRYRLKIQELEPVKHVTKGIITVYSLIIVFKIFKYFFAFFYTELKVIDHVDSKLKRFIRMNKLADIKVTKEGYEKVKYCPIITYQLFYDKLIVSFRLDGGPKTSNYCNFQNQLQGVIKLKCIKIEPGVTWCRYEFRRGEIEQAKVNDIINSDKKVSKDTIFINNQLKWNFRKAPHALITGITGSGKTYYLAYIIRMFLSYNAKVSIIDPKRSDMSFLEKYLGNNVAYNGDDIVTLLSNEVEDMENRFEDFKKHPEYGFGKDYFDYGYDPVIIIFDELMSFMGGSSDPEQKKYVMNSLLDIIAKGRQAGYFVILTTQRPDTKFIDGSIRDQLSLRVALGKMSNDGYKMVFGTGQNLKLTEKKKGAGYIFIDGLTEGPVEFNAPYLDPGYDFIDDIEKLTKDLDISKYFKKSKKEKVGVNFSEEDIKKN
ncbi:MAG: FtsK/SpoIIIE domain-containing protein [Clostridiales bacterium]